jgi:hypothetical protein
MKKNKIKTFWIITRENISGEELFEAVYKNKPSLSQLSIFLYRKDFNILEFNKKLKILKLSKGDRTVTDFGVYYLSKVDEGGFATLD